MEKKTWFLDIDGTIVEHRNNDQLDEILENLRNEGYVHKPGWFGTTKSVLDMPTELLGEVMLPLSQEFMNEIPRNDYIILTTAREQRHSWQTEEFLRRNGIQWNKAIYALPSGPRVLINDSEVARVDEKTGDEEWYVKAYGIPVKRNYGISGQNVKAYLYWNNSRYKNVVGVDHYLNSDDVNIMEKHDGMVQPEFDW